MPLIGQHEEQVAHLVLLGALPGEVAWPDAPVADLQH